MKIGILTFHAACNFGANLQLLSTYYYFKNKGYDVVVINWIPKDLENGYIQSTQLQQRELHEKLRQEHLSLTALCRTTRDVSSVIKEESIDAVVIGSDAVAQHHPFWGNIRFPARHIIAITKYNSSCMFPNPFWGDFSKFIERPIPIAVMSASSQNSPYSLFGLKVKKKMNMAVKQYCYLSVRDTWTQKMYKYVTNSKTVPEVTPDPVFAFNYNVMTIPSKEEILKKFGLEDKYILLGFLNKYKVNSCWLNRFLDIAHRNGYICATLPFPHGTLFKENVDVKIDIPLSPLDWYALIKYSSGYVGHNMHPIVIAIHNTVPFYSFDNYGISYFRVFVNKASSKIYHILSLAGFLDNRHCDVNLLKKVPSAELVFERLISFDKRKCLNFAKSYYDKYLNMMEAIEKCIIN